MKRLFLLMILSAILFSCGGEKKQNKANALAVGQDFEWTDCWVNTSCIVKGTAHSGDFACKLDTGNVFSTTFTRTLGAINSKMPKKVNVSLWVNPTVATPDASVVVDISDNGNNIFWGGNSFKDVVKNANEWTEFKTTFDLPATIKPNHLLKVYVWNNNKLNYILLDDFNIEFEY